MVLPRDVQFNITRGSVFQKCFRIGTVENCGNNDLCEFGGTLQNQQRNYFGPVNIHRMNVRLVNDRALADLNGANWSFSFASNCINRKVCNCS